MSTRGRFVFASLFASLAFIAACGGRVELDEPNPLLDATSEYNSPIPSSSVGSGGNDSVGSNGTGGFGGGCPPLSGPSMVQVPVYQNGDIIGGGFCIDSTEVTQRQYRQWLDSSPSTDGQPSYCDWNIDFTPSCTNEVAVPNNDPDLPQVCIDWCDAHMYCKGVGKRLCGTPAGGPTPYDSFADPEVSAWSYACMSAGVNEYGYGNEFDANACHVSGKIQPVGTSPTCQSNVPEFAGIFDLSGNIAEYEDACDGTTGRWDTCRTRGGGTYGVIPNETTRCASGGAGGFRGEATTVVGFRCCWP